MRRSSQSGITLIELVVVMAVMGVLAALAVTLFAEGLRTYQAGTDAATVLCDLRFALNYMVRELRSAEDVQLISPSEVIYRVADTPFERRFKQGDGAVRRYDNQPLCSHVQTLAFTLSEGVLGISIVSVEHVDGIRTGSGLPLKLSTTIKLRN